MHDIRTNTMIDKAAFSLENYFFNKVAINIESGEKGETLDLDFQPSGIFMQGEKQSIFNLQFVFVAKSQDLEVVKIHCKAVFKFAGSITFEEIPTYFYRNSMAIIFPYIRAFVSTVTLQANVMPILLPTVNLSSLESRLRENTKESK